MASADEHLQCVDTIDSENGDDTWLTHGRRNSDAGRLAVGADGQCVGAFLVASHRIGADGGPRSRQGVRMDGAVRGIAVSVPTDENALGRGLLTTARNSRTKARNLG